jgi:hypothetical protein
LHLDFHSTFGPIAGEPKESDLKQFSTACLVLCASALLAAQTAPNPLARRYHEGETLRYHMTAVNEDWHYTADASGTAKKTASGAFVEEFGWTGMSSNGQPLSLSPAAAGFRQTLSLDPAWMPGGPSLADAEPKMVGPITDLFTFYVDLWLINKIGFLRRAGDHFHVANPQPASWGDGTRVIVGKDHIDFDLNIQSIDEANHTAVVVVQHVPPAHPKLEFPADWMKDPVVPGSANNWIEVTKAEDGKYQAAAGKETFEVSLTVSTVDGRILSGVMENPVVSSGRVCEDAALTKCTPAQPHAIHRHVEIALQP